MTWLRISCLCAGAALAAPAPLDNPDLAIKIHARIAGTAAIGGEMEAYETTVAGTDVSFHMAPIPTLMISAATNARIGSTITNSSGARPPRSARSMPAMHLHSVRVAGE